MVFGHRKEATFEGYDMEHAVAYDIKLVYEEKHIMSIHPDELRSMTAMLPSSYELTSAATSPDTGPSAWGVGLPGCIRPVRP